jgi:hypothetical protein
METCPLRTRTVVAVEVGCSGVPPSSLPLSRSVCPYSAQVESGAELQCSGER